jgi:NAD(P)H-hydrate epimerase
VSVLITRETVKLPPRDPGGHKGTFGKVLIIAGSVGYSGAPVLAARAATSCGAGLVYLGVPEGIYGIAAAKCVGEIVFPLCSGGVISRDALPEIERRLAGCDCAVVGPGLRVSDAARDAVLLALERSRVPLILDADGINALAANINVLDNPACPVIITPHGGEFARIGGDPASGRETAARRFAEAHGVTVVLKGRGTVVASRDGDVFVNTTGGSALAKGGTGDVLAGMIGAFCAAGIPAAEAARTAVYLHGLAGDIAAERLSDYSVDPDDVLRAIPAAIKHTLGD